MSTPILATKLYIPPPPEKILTVLLNEITAVPDNFFIVLDNYIVRVELEREI